MNLGEYVRNARNNLDMSLREFARTAGVSPVVLSDIEHRGAKASPNVMRCIADALGIQVDVLGSLEPGPCEEKVGGSTFTFPCGKRR